MSLHRHIFRYAACTSLPAWRVASRRFSAQRAPLPVVPTCPAPVCACSPTPDVAGIDHTKKLDGTVAPYTRQVLVFTGQEDWKSRIDDEALNDREDGWWGRVLGYIKRGLGPNGTYHNVSGALRFLDC
jgi:hypothetical protein